MKADLATHLESARQRFDVPGIAVGVLDDGERWTWCAGVTNVEHPLPVDTRTIFQLASISKTFAGTAAMVLVDQGLLDLDTPVVSYLPDLVLSSRELTSQVTMRHLLTHVTGWVGDYFKDTGNGDDALAAYAVKLRKAPQLTPLGETYSYNNSAFNLAAHVVATVAGMPFERVVRRLVLKPLGMERTFYATDEAIVHRVAIGHRAGVPQPWQRSRAHAGASNVLSCADDLLTYAAFHLGDGAPLMRGDTLQLMHDDRRLAGSLCDEVAIVWMVDTHAGHVVLHHGGSSNGYQTDLRIVPELGLAWVMLTNADHHHQVDRVILRELVGVDPPPSFVPPDLDAFAGHYEAVLAHLDVSRTGAGLELTVATPPTATWLPGEEPPPPEHTRLGFRDVDRVVALDMPYTDHRGEFLRGPDGAVEWLRWDGRIHRRSR